MITVAISGGFDPIHIGHIRYIREASKLGDKLVAILNTDDFLIKKRGYCFMPLAERFEILQSIKGVDEVVIAIDNDDSVVKTIELIKPDILANGGDRTEETADPKERIVCEKINCKYVFGVGGKKIQSSSNLVNEYQRKTKL